MSEERLTTVGENFERTNHLFSTRTAEGFEALEKSTGERVLLWLLRFPLGLQSEEAARFVRRLKRISEIDVLVPQFKVYGVDGSGTAFLVTEYQGNRALLDSTSDPQDLEQIFIGMLKTLSPLHGAGVFLGDISEDSFLLSGEGEVKLIGVLGTFDSGARQTAMLPPADTLHYLAPEQRNGSGPDFASDVYALGVYGYRLFTGRYMLGDKPGGGSVENPVSTAPAPTIVREDLPKWVDDILGRCLEVKAENRYRDAQEILEAVEEAIHTGVAPGGTSAWSRRTLEVQPPSVPSDRELKDRKREIATRGTFLGSGDRSVAMFFWALALVVGVFVSGFIFFSLNIWDSTSSSSKVSSNEVGDPVSIHVEYAPEELRPLIRELGSSEVPLETRQKTLSKIAESSDPVAYGVLIAMLRSAHEPQLKKDALDLLVTRIRRLGLKQSADVLENWFEEMRRAGREPGMSPTLGQLLPACDPARPLKTRKNVLQQAFETESVVALQLAMALALDGSEEEFAPVVRKFLGGDMPQEELEERGLGALLLSHDALSIFVDRDVSETIKKFSDDDLRWALKRFGPEKRELMFELAKEAIRRKLLTPYQTLFLEFLVDSQGMRITGAWQEALIRGAFGEVKELDVRLFGKWISLSTERLLLAVCATAKDPSVVLFSFDVLAGRALRSEPTKSLIPWIKSRFWDYRKQVAKPVGVLGLSDIASKEDLDFAFKALMPFSAGGLFRVIVHTDNAYLTLQAVDRLGAITRSSDLLPLLAHVDPQVRGAAVKALSGRNELMVLQSVLRAYEKEGDEKVRRVYEEYHWVVRNRRNRERRS